MKCHYEVLGIAQDADDQELKSSYRRLALKWHPDKNIDNQEEATETFKLIQLAYQVLSDPHERAYYDRNKEFILRDGQPVEERNLVDIFKFFTTTCFKGFSDNDESFFATYRNVFEELAVEENQDLPCFGDSSSDYGDVVGPFYQNWEPFCTTLEFEWLYEQDPTQFRDRRFARRVKKENQRVRDAARKERNSNVRNLVLFVKKRDPRVLAHLAKLREKQEANRQYRESKREQQKQEKLKKIEEFQAPEWIPLDELEKQLRELEIQHDNAQLDAESEDCSFCIVCEKLFMSTKSFENHLNSKKHKQNEELVKRLMLEEEEKFNDEDVDEELERPVNADGVEELQEEMQADSCDEIGSDGEKATEKRRAKDKRKKKKQSLLVARFSESDSEERDDSALEFDDDAELEKPVKVSKKDRRKKKQPVKKEETAEDAERPQQTEMRADPDAALPTKLKGHKARAAKRKARSVDESSSAQPSTDSCTTCGTQFTSRNKMFEHLKRTGHAKACSNK